VSIPSGTLKSVIPLDEEAQVEQILHSRWPAEDIHVAGPKTFFVHTAASPEEIRDVLIAAGTAAIILEFERWSAYRAGGLADWLRRRGH
jgi:hypothetical protein